MRKSLDVFLELPCLTEQSRLLSGVTLQKKWFKAADKRIIGQYLQKFISYNSQFLNFLGVVPSIVGSDQAASLSFRSSQFIGSVPLRSPDTGKQIGDFVVTPRFLEKDRYTEYIEVLNLLGNTISPEFSASIPLVSGRNFRPPLYLEATKYILALEELLKRSWRKFDRQEKIINEPIGQVNWNKYISEEFKVENRQRFLVGKSILSEFHKEYAQIRYVFDLCKSELLSPNTPLRIKLSMRPRIAYLEERLYFHLPQKTSEIQIRNSDAPYVRNCKEQANKILQLDLLESTAWRVDFSDVFEKFSQHIFKEVSKELGGQIRTNSRLQGYSSKYYAWQLRHLEPDIILSLGGLTIFIDAKYKSHLFNKFDASDFLKEEHRHDLHQVLGYSAFSDTKLKFCFLCYPSDVLEISKIQYQNRDNSVINNLFILGLPFRKDVIPHAKHMLMGTISSIQKELSEVN